MQETEHQKQKVTSRILSVLAFTFGSFWIFIQLVSTVIYDLSVEIFHQLTKIPKESFVSEDYVSAPIPIVDEFFSGPFYALFVILSFITAIVGSLILTQKRSPIAIVGLLVGFFLPEERKFWGTIRDSSTEDPIPSAIIRIVKMNEDREAVLAETVADLDGKYRLQLNEYDTSMRLKIVASGYAPAIKELDYVPSSEKTYSITQDIDMDRTKTEGKGLGLLYLRPVLFKYLIWFIYIFSILLLATYILYTVSYPGTWYGAINTIIFTFAVVWNTYTIFKRYSDLEGRVLEVESNKPIYMAFVSIYKTTDSKLLGVQYTNKNGGVRFDVPPGNYIYKVGKTGYEDLTKESEEKDIREIKINNKGFLNKNIFLREASKKLASQTKSEMNISTPFG